MARIRTIKPGFFKDSELYDAEKASGLPLRVAYAGLWTIADREGRFRWLPREIKTDVLPYDDVSMSDVLESLAGYGFIIKYKCDGCEFGFIPKFSEHQHVNKNEASSTLPGPPAMGKSRAKKVYAPSKNINARASTVSAPSKHHEEGEWEQEGKGREQEGEKENNKTREDAREPQAALVIGAPQKPLKAEIPIWIPADAWAGFVEMRRKKRAPLTERAIRGLIGKLAKLRDKGHDPGAVLDQSTLNAWQDVFELRDKRGKSDNRIGFVDTPTPDPAAEYYAAIESEPP